MRLSLIQKSENYMYPYNAFNNSTPAPAYTMEAFVAPANFDPDAQELNIVQAFASYSDVNKKYVYSVSPAMASTTLDVVSGRSYAYSQNGGAYTIIASGTINWTGGSTKRHVIVIDSNSTVNALVPIGGVWAYLSKLCNVVYTISGNSTLKYIHCQDLSSITRISNYAFNACSSLTVVNISPFIETIDIGAFSNCSGLTAVTFPNSLKTIGNDAFYYCSNLTTVGTIPTSVTSIGTRVFEGCSKITAIIVDVNNANYSSDNGLLLNKNKTILMKCPEGKVGSVSIPASVTEIIDDAFIFCKYVTGSLILPPNLVRIGNLAFTNSTFSGSLTIPNSVTFMGNNAFSGCSGFTNALTISNGLTSLNAWAFNAVNHITSVIIPSSVSSIGQGIFDTCTSLTSIYSYRNSPATLASGVFYGVNKTACVLHVAVGSRAAYQAYEQWSDFANIIDDL